MNRNMEKPPHNERNRKTSPIRSKSCQKGYFCNTKTVILGHMDKTQDRYHMILLTLPYTEAQHRTTAD